MNKDMYEERVKRNIDTDNKSSESVYADKADKDRESAFDDISQAKLPESMALFAFARFADTERFLSNLSILLPP